MCELDPTQFETLKHLPLPGIGSPPLETSPATTGSRRRRLWEFDSHAHCPVVGVCLPIAALRRLVDKVLGAQAVADDYELHCGAIADCKHRSRMAEAVQRELDRRCMLALRQAAQAKTTEALEAWWCEASQGKDLAGAFWATLTHARCTPALEHRVLGEVHMLQHQVGMARRVDLNRFDAVLEEHGALTRELGTTTRRSARQAEEHARRSEWQQTQIAQLRAQVVGRDTLLAGLTEELQALQAATPGLKSRLDLAQECERLAERVQALQRGLQQAQQEAERQRRRADEQAEAQAPTTSRTDTDRAEPALPAVELNDRAVLCVGGRPASVPLYRHIVERSGGRFLHHDGGEEESVGKLEATLAAADLVVCQTGCVSHNAYWRVKDHCKRHGKRCVFVESPSSAGLKRALAELQPIV